MTSDAVAKERERCAQIAFDVGYSLADEANAKLNSGQTAFDLIIEAIERIAAAIRAALPGSQVTAIAGKEIEMAQAQVTLKVSPAELQIIDDALRMYAQVNRYLHRPEGYEYPLEGYQHNVRGGDARVVQMQANKLRQDIGLK